ncbi:MULTISPECIES: carboxymuconolactone decarboxylase family protein [unclassified Nocardioides]|uniref:carboxymuconolactone decarboxylase family protein n=1 Tax=unclassified Nocardioides TaxID=2615069 RepID=UPI0006FE4467|nr:MULTISPECIES: carboxymuconolactone decarboxylase family protein [unclassified Nocardioides]KQY50239.1 carboxymuconolactone decarboxylase [Nocardioides sp. Root140]KRF14935.1 carboxymuconolactone decarboxylase [Nocardioides sp. Soil796]
MPSKTPSKTTSKTTSNFRIPKAELDGIYGRMLSGYAKRTYGEVPDFAYVMYHHKPLTKAILSFEGKVAKFSALDPNLKSYAEMASAAMIGCSWCMDFGYFMAHNKGLDEAKIRQVPVWRDSDVFTPLERDVLEYAEAMTATPPEVDDEMVDNLHRQLGVEATVELTAMISLENMRSRTNAAMGLASQGYSDTCELAPLAR